MNRSKLGYPLWKVNDDEYQSH